MVEMVISKTKHVGFKSLHCLYINEVKKMKDFINIHTIKEGKPVEYNGAYNMVKDFKPCQTCKKT